MPIVKIEENGESMYVGCSEGFEIRVSAVAEEYEVCRSRARDVVEHSLREYYLKRLEEHAHDCALLGHLVANPPDDSESRLPSLRAVDRLAHKVVEDGIWLRTNDPFVSLYADVVRDNPDETKGTYGTQLQAEDGEGMYPADEDGWDDSSAILRKRSPWWRARKEEEQRAEREREEKYALKSPKAKRLVDEAAKLVDEAGKAEKRATARRAARGARKTRRAA